jgi:MscS family membrane protein
MKVMKSAASWIVCIFLLCIWPLAQAQSESESESAAVSEATSEAQGESKIAVPPNDTPTVRQIVEGEAKSEALAREVAAASKAGGFNRKTPRASLVFLSSVLAADDMQQAAEFLDLRYLPKGIDRGDGPELMTQLRYIFSRHIWIDIASLSDEPEGWQDDGLPDYRDSLGSIETSNGPVELYLQRIPDGNGDREWKISNATVSQIPTLWTEFGYSDFSKHVAEVLPPWHWLGIDNWQWAYLLVFILCMATAVWLLSALLRRLAQNSDAVWITVLQNFIAGSMGMFFYIMALRLFMLNLGLSVIARALFESTLLVYLAYFFLVLGVVNFFANRMRRHMVRAGRPEATSIVRPISAVIKMVLVAIVFIMGLDNAGYDVTTIIAGLGVSSVAVALAAQKTLENLIGAITIYVARPVQPGDLCRFGDVTGRVEEIGLRSTVLRTLDRTLVNIPNAVFAASEIENISARDNIRYYRMIALRLGSTPDQLRFVLARLRELLYSHPAIVSDSISVRLFNINDYAYMVRMDSRVNSNDFQQYLAIAEDINLRIIDLVNESGTNFAYPSQTIMVEDAAPLDASQKQQVEALVEQWREQDKLPFPQWPDEYVSQVENTLEYPSKGSSGYRRNTEDSDDSGR